MKIKFKKLHPDAKMPQKAHDDDFCYDVWAVSEEEIAPNVWRYGLGFALEIVRDLNCYSKDFSLDIDIRPRSSVYKTGMVLSNCEGTCDECYRGEVSAVFYHLFPNMPRYKVGDKIAQIKMGVTEVLDFIEVDELSKTDRGAGGYGSTGN